jgi:hypothetical protein
MFALLRMTQLETTQLDGEVGYIACECSSFVFLMVAVD